MSTKMPLDLSYLGLHTFASAAPIVGVTPEQVSKWFQLGSGPARYRNIFQNMKTAVILPMDEPPSAKVIGYIGHTGLRLLARLELEYAEALASKAMRGGSKDLNTNKPWNLSVLQGECVRLVHASAWARSVHRAESEDGLPALYALHLDVSAHMKRLRTTSPDYHGWEFLHAQTLGGALGYFTGRLGLDWFLKPHRKGWRTDMVRLRAVANRFLRRLDRHKHKWQKSGFYQDHITTQIAFNVAQIAALADSTHAFGEALTTLLEKHEKRFDNVIFIMNDDPDTALMMLKPEIQILIAQFLARRSGKSH